MFNIRSHDDDPRVQKAKSLITTHPDFPKPGIVFRDVFPVLYDPPAFKGLIDVLEELVRAKYSTVTAVVGLDSRGFIFGPLLALQLNVKFVPIRKKGKLPGEIVRQTYTLEYGEDSIDVQKDALSEDDHVVIVDDLLATGGTMAAACSLLDQLRCKVDACMCIIELDDLNGRDKVKYPMHCLIHY